MQDTYSSYTCIGNTIFFFVFLAGMEKNAKSDIDWFIVNRVREIRIDKNVSQADIAYHLNLSVDFIGHNESLNFRAKYNTIHLNELAKLFNCSPKDFWPEKGI